jgi:hypothetical protein
VHSGRLSIPSRGAVAEEFLALGAERNRLALLDRLREIEDRSRRLPDSGEIRLAVGGLWRRRAQVR